MTLYNVIDRIIRNIAAKVALVCCFRNLDCKRERVAAKLGFSRRVQSGNITLYFPSYIQSVN